MVLSISRLATVVILIVVVACVVLALSAVGVVLGVSLVFLIGP
jgi:hypothetical protein